MSDKRFLSVNLQVRGVDFTPGLLLSCLCGFLSPSSVLTEYPRIPIKPLQHPDTGCTQLRNMVVFERLKELLVHLEAN